MNNIPTSLNPEQNESEPHEREPYITPPPPNPPNFKNPGPLKRFQPESPRIPSEPLSPGTAMEPDMNITTTREEPLGESPGETVSQGGAGLQQGEPFVTPPPTPPTVPNQMRGWRRITRLISYGIIIGVFAYVGITWANTPNFLPNMISSIQNSTGTTQKVSGRYVRHFDQGEIKTGSSSLDATSSAQNWSYVFNNNGTYDAYLNDSLQYAVGGTWSQAGSVLTMNFRGDGQNVAAYSAKATVSQDAGYITFGGNGDRYIWVSK